MKYTVLSLDMWGHVSADCAEYGCDCMVYGEHDDNACQCSEDCNQQFRAGEVEIDENDDDDALLDVLTSEGFLTDEGRKVAIVGYSNGDMADINDAQGRRLYALERVESCDN